MSAQKGQDGEGAREMTVTRMKATTFRLLLRVAFLNFEV
jgi:hypothetical protein